MRTIQCMPDGNNDDGSLTARLFELALNGDTDSAELNAVEAVVYARLEETYGRDENAPRRVPSCRPEGRRLNPMSGSTGAARISAPTLGSMNSMNSTP